MRGKMPKIYAIFGTVIDRTYGKIKSTETNTKDASLRSEAYAPDFFRKSVPRFGFFQGFRDKGEDESKNVSVYCVKLNITFSNI